MDINIGKKLLDILIEDSARILRAGFGVNYAESAFFSVKALLKENLELKTYFVDRVEYMLSLGDPGCLDDGIIPEELIELVAHEMQWDEMRILAKNRIRNSFNGDTSRAVGDISYRIIEALTDNWPDKEFYVHYRNT